MNMLTAWWSQSSSTTMNLLVKPLAFAKSGSTTHIFRKIRFKHHLSMGLFISFLQKHQFLLNQLFCVFFSEEPDLFHHFSMGFCWGKPGMFHHSSDFLGAKPVLFHHFPWISWTNTAFSWMIYWENQGSTVQPPSHRAMASRRLVSNFFFQ